MNHVKRATGLDVIKGICMLGLPFVHFTEQLAYNEMCGYDQISIIALTVFGPAIFLICMGFELVSKGTPKYFLRLGFQMLAIGFFLNIFRYLIPGVLALLSNIENASWKSIIGCLLCSDIYFVVGFFYLLLAGFKKLKLSDFFSLMVAIMMLSINTVITGLIQNQYPTDWENCFQIFLGNFFYLNETSIFPILSWAIYPLIGIIFAKGFKDSITDNQKIGRLVVASVVALIALYASLWYFDVDLLMVTVNPANAYMTELFNAMIQIGFTFLVVGVIQMIINSTRENVVERYFKRLSLYLMPYYFIHWIIVEVTVIIIAIVTGGTLITLPVSISISICIMLLSIFLSTKFGLRLMRFLLGLTSFNRKRKQGRRIQYSGGKNER